MAVDRLRMGSVFRSIHGYGVDDELITDCRNKGGAECSPHDTPPC